METTQITFFVDVADNEVRPIATGRTIVECAITLIPDFQVEYARFRAFREIVTGLDTSDNPVIGVDEGILDIRNGWLFFTPQYTIRVDGTIPDERD